MKKIEITGVKDAMNKGVDATKEAFDTAKSVRLKTKCDCNIRLTSEKKDKDLFHCGFAFDKDFQLLKVIGITLAAASVVAAAAVVTDVLVKNSKSSAE